jgi:hypothetical protein
MAFRALYFEDKYIGMCMYRYILSFDFVPGISWPFPETCLPHSLATVILFVVTSCSAPFNSLRSDYRLPYRLMRAVLLGLSLAIPSPSIGSHV